MLWRAGRRCSKTHTISDAAITEGCTRPSVTLILAPTFRQANDGIFGQIRRTHKATPGLPGELLKTRWDFGPMHYIAPVSTNDPDRIRGQHADIVLPYDTLDRDPDPGEIQELIDESLKLIEEGEKAAADGGSELLIILDEIFGIPSEIIQALEGSMQGPSVRVFGAGNPHKDPHDPHPGVRWCVEEVSRFFRIKSSHLSEELFPDPVPADAVFDRGFGALHEGVPEERVGKYGVTGFLADRPWIAEQERAWGTDAGIFKSDILGQFSANEEGLAVIPVSFLAAAKGECKLPDIGAHVGVDLSAGGDLTVLVLQVNGLVRACHSWRPDTSSPTCTMDVSKRVFEIVKGWSAQLVAAGVIRKAIPAANVHVDNGTFGRTICELLYTMDLPVDRVDFGAEPRGDWLELHGGAKFRNLRAEMFFNVRNGLRDRLFEVPKTAEFEQIWAQLPWTLYNDVVWNGRTVFQLERKEEVKKRHKASPDFADATVLAFLKARSGSFGFRRPS